MERFPLGKPLHCLLPTNTNSTVRQYADEFVFVKYPYLFRSLISVSRFIDTLRPAHTSRSFYVFRVLQVYMVCNMQKERGLSCLALLQ